MAGHSRFFKLYLATAIAPIPMASFAGQPSSSIGVAFLKSYAAICLRRITDLPPLRMWSFWTRTALCPCRWRAGPI